MSNRESIENLVVERESIENLVVEKALNAACSSVQSHFNITDGGFAEMFFMGDNGDKLRDAIKAYIKAERVWDND